MPVGSIGTATGEATDHVGRIRGTTAPCMPAAAQHRMQRGNNRQPSFGRTEDFAAYAHWLREAAQRLWVSVHAWVFTTNPIHLLVAPATQRIRLLSPKLSRNFAYPP